MNRVEKSLKFLKNIKLKKLLTMFFGIELFMLLLLGIFSVKNIQAMAEDTQTLYDRPHTNLVGMWETKARIAQTGNGIREWILYQEPLSDELSNNLSSVSQMLTDIEGNKVDKTQPMSDNMKNILESVKAWENKGKEVVASLKAGERVSGEKMTEYTELERNAINNIDTIIVTASENALKFRDSSVGHEKSIMFITVIIFGITFLLTIAILSTITKIIMRPIAVLLKEARQIRAGDLESDNMYEAANEFGELASCFHEMQMYLQSVINDVTDNLNRMERGDFRVSANVEYTGAFESIRDSLYGISKHLGAALLRINESAEQVSGSSANVSLGAQQLSQGTVEQASSLEQLSGSIMEVSSQIEKNSESAKDASGQAEETSKELAVGQDNMQRMLEAMSQINGTSGEIGKIIKTIEDIAFQTNILALNAAVEAARAGEAGKGFAVVADEVRNLAGKSSEASKNTTQLIENSINSVKEGTAIANKTAESLVLIAKSSERSADLLKQISQASVAQAESVNMIRKGMEQISMVVQSSAATAEESAASSEELSGQAQMLKELVSEFKFANEVR